MPSSDALAPSSKSGIQTSATGDSYIPSSTRADGSKRKEIRVRPGYRPPEDVEVYKNRTAEAWKNRGSGGVPGAELATRNGDARHEPQNKNAKRREARKKVAASTKATDSDFKGNGVNNASHAKGVQDNASDLIETMTPVDEEAEKEKKARNLKKKLRQAKELRQKKDQGESLLPEQFTKVMKIHELIRELNQLGFDTDGEEKKL